MLLKNVCESKSIVDSQTKHSVVAIQIGTFFNNDLEINELVAFKSCAQKLTMIMWGLHNWDLCSIRRKLELAVSRSLLVAVAASKLLRSQLGASCQIPTR